MNGGRSDASTSTDDVKGRPLCLFYFTHPFGVLSPEPPTALGAAPAHIARAFLNMEPVSPFYWPAAGPDTDSYRSTATGDTYDLGAATVHAHPVSVLSVRHARARAAPPPRPRQDSLSSSLFSSELWFESTCSSRAAAAEPPPRRLLPYNRMLPPLRLPSARTLSECSSEDVWPRKCLHPEKFSLPPISLPVAARASSRALLARPAAGAGLDGGVGRSAHARRRRGLGVDKQRRRRRAAAADVRRVLAALIRRAVTGLVDVKEGKISIKVDLKPSQPEGRGECSPSPALLRVLATIRDAWAEPTTLRERCGTLNRTFERWMMEGQPPPPPRAARAPLEAPASPRPHASPGLMRRRYSVPETIMRKYRLAQQGSDSEESVATATRWSACPSPAREVSHSPCDSPHRFMRRDRELMRKSALLRRMWARPCPAAACRCCEDARATRSLDGSRSELSSRRSPVPAPRAAPWTESKRQRLEPPAAPTATDLSDSTFQSHCAGACDTTDAFTDTVSPPSSRRLSERATAEIDRSPPDSDARDDRSYPDSDALSVSVSTAKESSGSPPRDSYSSNGRIEGRVSERSAGVDNDDRNVPSYERPLAADTPLYELLEIVVSESADTAADVREGNAPLMATALTLKNAQSIDIDEYVSNILVESLNSLTDQLESMNASIGGHRRVSIVEKEIKVRLQNTGVNTIVHLSPTSNNQIIFGNEELCNEPRARDECNNPLSIREERDPGLESNDNLTSSAGSGAPPPAPPPRAPFDPPLQRDGVNRAVLQQIQKLFRDELRGLEEGESPAAGGGVSHVEISNVDAYIEAHCAEGAARPELEITTRADDDIMAGVGTGNYFRDGYEAATVPRFSAFPHTESMEVNTSSSSEGEAARSECTSLVDSLDDPNSPRAVPVRRRDLVRSAVDVLELLPDRPRDASAESRAEAFFVRIEDDDLDRHDPDRLEENVRVAEYMPEKIKQRLYRRHRKRELRVECARRSKVKQLKKELEQRRLEEAAAARRDLERDCMAIVNALIDDVVAKIAQDEYKCMRIKRRNGKLPATRSEENLARRSRRRDLGSLEDGDGGAIVKRGSSRHSSNKENRQSERRHIHGKLLARPSLTNPDRPPRRIYQKSEIHEGEKCIEILEILEYVNGSPSSPETTNSDENHNHNARCKKSRIPIPVYERMQRTSSDEGRMRLTGGDGRRGSPPPTGRMLASMLLQALEDSPPNHAPAPPEPRSRSNSLRFKQVFDIIPEERSSLSFDSSAEDAELARRASAPEVSVPVALPAAPAPAVTSTRSAGTSPLEERTRTLRSQTTMTSPCSKSAATSPLRPAAPPAPPALPARPAPPRPTREGRGREKSVETEKPAPRPPAGERRTPTVDHGSEVRGRRGRCGSAAGGERAPRPAPRARAGSTSSDSGDSGGSLLCSLAPRWLSTHARQRRRARRPHPPPAPAPTARTLHDEQARPPPLTDREPVGEGGGGGGGGEAGSGGWSVTVAGSCRAALPADVEMRLRFPPEPGAPPTHRTAPDSRRAAPQPLSAASYQGCTCVQCARCAGVRAALPPAPGSPLADPRLTLTMKKEAQDSSILASKSLRKSSEQLPELETYRASRTKTKSSVKTRRGYSLHCWLPDDEPAPIRVNNGLSVLGCAIIPELKPRVPTMSERDLTRVYTPRHYLRS